MSGTFACLLPRNSIDSGISPAPLRLGRWSGAATGQRADAGNDEPQE